VSSSRRPFGATGVARGDDTEGREYRIPYLNHVLGLYDGLDFDRNDPRLKAICEGVEQIRAKRDATPGLITTAEIFTVERTLLKFMNLDELRQRVMSLRDKYRLDAGEAGYSVYLASNPSDPGTATLEALRADMLHLTDELHWLYTITPVRERVRSRITVKISIYLMIIGIVGTLYGLVAQRYCPVGFSWIAPLTMFLGAAGAFVSLQRRIQSIPTSGDPIFNIFALEEGMASVYLSPVSGALFAMLAYLLFTSGYLQGEIFPKFKEKENAPAAPPVTHSLMTGYLREMEPATTADLAKLLIWAFVAGFAERLIPDTLNRLIVRKLDSVVNVGTSSGPARPSLRDLTREQADADRAATDAKEDADKRAAQEKAAAEAEATRKKKDAELRAAETAPAGPDDQAALARQLAEEKAAAEAEATRKKKDAETRAAEEKAAAETAATNALEEAASGSATVEGEGRKPEPTLPTGSATTPPGPAGAPAPKPGP
jgi:hypothetical protein